MTDRIDRLFAQLEQLARSHMLRMRAIAAAAQFFTLILEHDMHTEKELLDKVGDLKSAVDAFKTREQSTIDSLTAANADLKAKLAAGEDTTPVFDQIQAVIDSLSAVPVTPPAPTT